MTADNTKGPHMELYPDPQLRLKVREVLAVQLAAMNGDMDGMVRLLGEADALQLRRWCAYLALTQAEMARDALPGFHEKLLEVALMASH